MTTNNPSATQRYISVQDVANDVQVSDQLIWKLIRQGRFPAKIIRLGSVIRIERASWDAFLASGSDFAPAPTKKGRPRKTVPPLDMSRMREISLA